MNNKKLMTIIKLLIDHDELVNDGKEGSIECVLITNMLNQYTPSSIMCAVGVMSTAKAYGYALYIN